MKSRRLQIFLGFAVLALLVAIAVNWFGRSPASSVRPAPLPQDPFIQVYTNHNPTDSANYTEPYRKIAREGDNLEQIIVDAIASAQSSIDVAVQELRLPNIALALAAKRQAGLNVRVVLENTYNRAWGDFSAAEIQQLDARERDRYNDFLASSDLDKDGKLSDDEINQTDALIILRNAGIPVIDDTADGSKGSGLMHHKFIAIDGVTTIVTSANFTPSDIHGDFNAPETRGNANNLLAIRDATLTAIFAQEFNLLWGDGPGGKPDSNFGVQKPYRPAQQLQIGHSLVTVQFSPTSATQPWSYSTNGLIGQVLNRADESANLALFVFSEQPLANLLETRHQQGVKIQALIDPEFAFRSYSEGLDLLGVALSDRCKYELDNQPWQSPISTVGVPQLPKGDKLHHKFGIIDDTIVITGSHNWSEAGNRNNDETLLVIENPIVAAHYKREFERLYKGATLGIPAPVRQKIETQQKTCPQISAPTSAATPTATGELTVEKVDVNIATRAELEALPGIGPTLAKRILEARRLRPFTSLDDFAQRVPGISPKLRNQLAERITW